MLYTKFNIIVNLANKTDKNSERFYIELALYEPEIYDASRISIRKPFAGELHASEYSTFYYREAQIPVHSSEGTTLRKWQRIGWVQIS